MRTALFWVITQLVAVVSVLVNNQLDSQFFFSYICIPLLYMFRAPLYSSSGELIVLIRHLVYVTLCRWPSSVQVWFYPNLLYIHIYIYTYIFIYLFILIIYMFRAPLCSSSGESIVLIRRYIFIYLFQFSTCFEHPCTHHQ